MNLVDPLPGRIGKRGEVFLGGQIRLEAPYLTGRNSLLGDGMIVEDPPHDRVEAEPVGMIHVVVPAKTSENGMAELPDKAVATVLPASGVREARSRQSRSVRSHHPAPDTATSRRRK